MRVPKPPPPPPAVGAYGLSGGDAITTDYITDDDLRVVLSLLMPRNRLVCQVAIQTGLRIGDVVALPADLPQRASVREQKTGKTRRIYLPADLHKACLVQQRPPWLFPGRAGSRTGHITRQAVWQDIKRAQKAMRVRDQNFAPHSLRKIYAVNTFRKSRDLSAVQKALNHDDLAVTMLYALADQVRQRRPKRRRRQSKKGKG